MKVLGVHHAFVRHQLIALDFSLGSNLLACLVSHNFVRIKEGDRSGVFLRLLNFLQDIALEDAEVQLLLVSSIQRKSTNLAFHFPFFGAVSIIFRSRGGELDNDILIIHFILKLAEVRAGRKLGLAWRVFVNDAVRVHVQNLLGLLLQEGLTVQMEACVARGETGHRNIDVELNGRGICNFVVDEFQNFLVDHADRMNVHVIVIE